MTSNQIVEHLAREFSTTSELVRNTLEMVDAGLSAPFIGRVRREATGGLSEGFVRRLDRCRGELDELERRRGTILRMLAPPSAPRSPGGPQVRQEKAAGSEGPSPDDIGAGAGVGEADGSGGARDRARPLSVDEAVLERLRTCMERFDLEDLFLPHRRPEPEVQLALDRGLGRLADELVAPVPMPAREGSGPEAEEAEALDPLERASGHAPDEIAPAHESDAPFPADHDAAADAAAPAASPGAPIEAVSAESAAQAASGEPMQPSLPDEGAPPSAPAEALPPGSDDERSQADAARAARAAREAAEHALLHGQIELTPALARLCAPYVNPDKGVHTESEALAGAMRILSDRLGRDPRLRGTLRRMLARQGVLSVRAAIDESRLGRHKPLLRIRQALRQIQGQRLLAIRQAQKERAITTVLALDRSLALPKVRAALGRHTSPEFNSVLDAIALRTLEHRLLPVLEADVRLELKERADEEALRFLSQHLRQILLTPPLGAREVCGLDVSPKGDWTLALLDLEGRLQGPPVRIEMARGEAAPEGRGPKDAAALGAELKAALCPGERPLVREIAVGHGRGGRAALPALRSALAAAQIDVFVHVVDESGVSSYASAELGRSELPELSIPQRVAVSLGRRLQDPMNEILKVDPRHLGLGTEQGLVSKANLKRALDETIESCVALVGCDVQRAPLARLRFVPGFDLAAAERIVAKRAERPIESREELRAEGLLSEVQWTSAAAFLRVPGGPEPLDATGLHPEQYDLARRVLLAAGTSVEDGLGRPGAARGLRREDFGVDESTWRDLMRELSYPGRDPRPFQHRVRLLDPQVDRATLARGRVIEGVISNVASFGAFVDIGLEQDGLIHVSEISDRYVRDARELVSVGQAVRVRILDGQAARAALSLKNVPPPEREGGREGRRWEGRDRGPRERGGGRFERSEEPSAAVRAAQTRRDGLAGARPRRERRGDRPARGSERGFAGRPSGGDPAHPRGRPRGRGEREEGYRPEDLRSASKGPDNKPFAAFFKTAVPPKPAE